MENDLKDLSPIKNPMNSFLIEKRYSNVDKSFNELINIVENLPRTKKLESSTKYWKGVCRSFIFRFPDDLEILKKYINTKGNHKEGYIQIRSVARLGQSDLGVNQNRVYYLINELNKIN